MLRYASCAGVLMTERVVQFQKWMLDNEDFMDRLGRHAARRIADSMMRSGEVDWQEVIDRLSEDLEREMRWFSPRTLA